VSEELQRERQRTMDPLDAAPMLLFDEVQDLVKDARLARAGGRLILSVLGTLLVSYGVDRRAVRAMVTGSSAEVAFAFEECSPLRGAPSLHRAALWRGSPCPLRGQWVVRRCCGALLPLRGARSVERRCCDARPRCACVRPVSPLLRLAVGLTI
jgi:hypothetical protein